ncbi:MAG: bifunctional [glutamate--ammonia ligase]-adenylyl-L-tyrosine phosphorylase/[glutamate--ammonia-ligase] adenylyltransferase [Pirellulales bacterium]|nr:bifunctional [glutamate--ammonia ligase]-adenylyl-L-tyrosine phosphorylase/[glutamate--ammonia-ligase] adenylyltransferase [Pirellulales bacterium]
MMNIPTLRRYLDDFSAAAAWLRGLGLADLRRGHGNLLGMAEAGVPLDLLAAMAAQLEKNMPACADPDMALTNLERFVRAARNPLSMGTLFERDPEALPTLLQIMSASQHLSEVLVNDPEGFDLLRLTEGAPSARRMLVDDIAAEIAALDHDPAVLRALRRFKRRETLRIAYGDILREQPLKVVALQISYLADALLEAALRAAGRKLGAQRGTPMAPDGKPARFTVLGMGKLGGWELNYSSDIDLIYLYDYDGKTDGSRSISNREFFEQLAREMNRFIAERTELGSVYRVDLRLRPEGERGPMVVSLESAMRYYDLRGRTWERQAFIKARPVAGSLELGREFLEALTPWIYRRYLTAADIAGIKALKRRIEQQTHRAGADDREVKTGHGGIRDIEFVIQFLQLLNGGALPEVRTGNTLEALARLERAGCLTNLERTLLEENYGFLRKVEHRLQIMFDLQTHLLPKDEAELRKLALRMSYADAPGSSALGAFLADYRNKTQLNRKILDHLLHDAFRDEGGTAAEVDLVLDPDPQEDRIAEVLGKYPFRDLKQAYRHLMALSEEKLRFLSTRRCRHFLAAIAPQLLSAIAATADPDATLVNLGTVSESLGGKGVLWELFSFNPPSLRMYVELCAYSPYLSSILTGNPGMIDSLMDSLVLDKLPDREWLENTLAELCRAAEDIERILHSFKNDQQLCVGVRDILGKEDVQATTGALGDIAEVCLGEIAAREYAKLAARFGIPRAGKEDEKRAGRPCEWVILGMGKFGGREMNYRSDLDLIFLYEADGHTAPPAGMPARQTTTNQHFFSELGQRIIKIASHLGAYGRLYEVDARLRPTGKSGTLATTFAELARYFAEGSGQLWERQALCKSRVVFGSPRGARLAKSAAAKAAFGRRWRRQDAEEIRRMRKRMEDAAAAGDMKRGPGGIVDVEFLVQMLQLRHARTNPQLRQPNTLKALRAFFAAGVLDADDYEIFDAGYRLLRSIEGRLRLMNSTARDQIPQDPTELAKLSHLLHYPSSDGLLMDYENATRQIRQRFDRLFDEASGKTAARED